MQHESVAEHAPAAQAAPLAFVGALKRSSRNPRLYTPLIYVLVLVVFLGTGLLAPLLAPHDPTAQFLAGRLKPPVWQAGGSAAHLLGTDSLGRDELSRLIYGDRISLIVALVSVPASVALGVLAGLIAGLRGRLIESLIMRIVDVQLALPAILVAILLAAIFGPSLRNVLLVIVGFGWINYARVVRGEVAVLRRREFIGAAQALGAGQLWVVRKHLLPNLINVVMVLATLHLSTVILIEAALSFLGVGVPITTASWGNMVSSGNDFITVAWWLVTIPGLAIVCVSLVANLFGDWLRDALDPRLRHSR